MGKVEEYRHKLRSLRSWDAYLMRESRLPGPRANLELAFAVALEGTEGLFLRYADIDSTAAPRDSKEEYLAICGVIGLGYLAARGGGEHFHIVRAKASDRRWRIREAVALGLQKFGEASMESLLDLMRKWSKGSLLEKRAVIASLCEPCLLSNRDHAGKAIVILDRITASLLQEKDRRSEDFKVLRKALAYGWSVAAAAQPSIGKPRMEEWVGSPDQDIRWIMKQNLRKKRLLRMDEKWVKSQLDRLG